MTEQLTKRDELSLRAFERQMARLRKSSIVKQGKLKLSLTTKIDLPSGEVVASFQGFDPELFQAQLPILRQFMMSKEAVNFDCIDEIINRCCDRPELIEWTRRARKEWDCRLASLPGEVHQHFFKIGLSVKEALDNVFYGYGGLFHVDINANEEDASVRAIQDGMLHQAFPYLCWCLNVFDSVIHWWLDAPEEAVPPLPAI